MVKVVLVEKMEEDVHGTNWMEVVWERWRCSSACSESSS